MDALIGLNREEKKFQIKPWDKTEKAKHIPEHKHIYNKKTDWVLTYVTCFGPANRTEQSRSCIRNNSILMSNPYFVGSFYYYYHFIIIIIFFVAVYLHNFIALLLILYTTAKDNFNKKWTRWLDWIGKKRNSRLSLETKQKKQSIFRNTNTSITKRPIGF